MIMAETFVTWLLRHDDRELYGPIADLAVDVRRDRADGWRGRSAEALRSRMHQLHAIWEAFDALDAAIALHRREQQK